MHYKRNLDSRFRGNDRRRQNVEQPEHRPVTAKEISSLSQIFAVD